jgi:hypothetical protein
MSAISLFGLDGIRYLDKVSDYNLVYYNRIELSRIDKGQFTTLSGREKRRLIHAGILLYNRPDRWELSPKGKMLLDSIQQESKH